MTSDTSTPAPPGGWHRRHRLVSREQLAAGYESRYGSTAVSDYALAVRDLVEQCPDIGPVDTWSRLSARICRKGSGRDWATWRRRLSRHFTTETKGPPWQTVVLVVECTVAEANRTATLRRFAQLYEAARGERPTSDRRRGTVDPAHLDDADPQPARSGGAAPTGDDTDAMLDALRGENATLRRRLAAWKAENELLRATIEAANRAAPKRHPQHRPLGGGSRPDDVPRQRESTLLAGPARKDRNPGHFPAGPTSTNDAPPGRHHRPPRIDTVSLPPRLDVVSAPTHPVAPLPYAPGGLRRD
ncbi:hypothetical protein ACIG87_09685 [Micromonospora sp. NPDC051925]|uniref:hypothetical protein n=1 Tax=Micromonospora sp. NPDC051925 TaxID=3364288 RepID=UPI0037C7DC7F